MELFTNIRLYIDQNGKYCIACKKQDFQIKELAKTVLTTIKPYDKDFKTDDINEANKVLQMIYPYLHPKAKVTNSTKLFKSQKFANQKSDIEYRYFFRPEFNRVLKPASLGRIEWEIESKDLQTEYKEMFNKELHFCYEQFAQTIQKEEKRIAAAEKKEQKNSEKHVHASKTLLRCVRFAAKALGYRR